MVRGPGHWSFRPVASSLPQEGPTVSAWIHYRDTFKIHYLGLDGRWRNTAKTFDTEDEADQWARTSSVMVAYTVVRHAESKRSGIVDLRSK